MIRLLLYSLLLLLGNVLLLPAQSVVSELKKIKAADSSCTNISMNISYNVYANFITQVPYEKLRGVFKKSGTNYLSDVGGIVTIRNEKMMFSVDTLSDQIILSDHQTGLYRLAGVALDTLVPFFAKTSVSTLSNGQRLISLVFNEEHEYEYEKIQVLYNPETYFITKLILYYSNPQSLDEEEDMAEEKPRMEILYKNINTNNIVPQSLFSEKEYMLLQASGVRGVGKYAAYEIIDDRKIARSVKKKN